LTAEVIENAPVIDGLFEKDEWGGCNQCYLLSSGMIGVIGHKCYPIKNSDGSLAQQVYVNIAFALDASTRQASNVHIIGTRSCYPVGPSKQPHLTDCAFTSGIELRKDGKADCFSGLGDCEEGRIVIDYPFSENGTILPTTNVSTKQEAF
jgi:hypothetical protein